MAQCYCQKCGRTMVEGNFYTYKDGKKTELCKNCLTMHIDYFDENTYLWLLEKMDVPYIPSIWNTQRDRVFARDPKKVGGPSIFGKYLSAMKLSQYKNYGWADTERLRAEDDAKAQAAAEANKEQKAILQERHEKGEISDAEYKTLMDTATQKEQYYQSLSTKSAVGDNNAYDENKFMDEKELDALTEDFSQEDKIYLAMKWGTLYTPREWAELERMYREMEQSFDIQDADSKNTLILLCKTLLKSNQAIDNGDFEGYQKLSKVAESLRKSAKFTAAQNKADKDDQFDSIGQLVAFCEREGGFIPRYATDIPQDVVDFTLKDMNEYVRRLVTEDLGLGQQIEDAIRKFQVQKEIADAEAAKAPEEEDDPFTLSDEDLEALYTDIDEQKDLDKIQMNEGDS